MPKRSKKSKSKRLTLKQKYKVIKKVREHHRKKRRELRKSGREGAIPKGQKDPGIPSQWPFKEELLKEMAWKRQQILQQEKEKREQRKRAREERANGGANADMDAERGDQQQLAALSAGAAAKEADFDARKRARLVSGGAASAAAGGGGSGDADSSRRAFYREFRRVVEAADVVIQVLDARDPAGCRCPDVERYVRSLDPSKRIVLLLNKMDLVPREAGEAWLKHYRRELPTVAFKASTGGGLGQDGGGGGGTSGRKGGGKKAGGGGKHAGGGAGAGAAAGAGAGTSAATCLGADTLLQLLKNYARNRAGGKGSITVGVVGLPNVGKSSLINSLKRARVAQVGSTPGVTTGVQEVKLDKNIRLLDSPGIVFGGSADDGATAAALRNAVKVERLADPLTPVAEILRRVPAKQLVKAYNIAAFDGLDGFLQQVAEARGKLKKGGVVDVEAAARIVLSDWNDGRIPFFTLPPKDDRANAALESAQVVSEWAADFDADSVFADEASAVIAHLPALAEGVGGGGGSFFEAAPGEAVAMAAEGKADAAAANGDVMDGSDVDDDDDAKATAAAAAAAAAAKAARAAVKAAHGENADLYGAEGQHNPKRARADKRRRSKEATKVPAAAAADGDDDDDAFDFDEANAAEGLQVDGDGMSGSDVEEEEDESGSGDDNGDDDDEYGAAAGDERDADRDYEEAMET